MLIALRYIRASGLVAASEHYVFSVALHPPRQKTQFSVKLRRSELDCCKLTSMVLPAHPVCDRIHHKINFSSHIMVSGCCEDV